MKALEPLIGGLIETICCFIKLENRTLVGRAQWSNETMNNFKYYCNATLKGQLAAF